MKNIVLTFLFTLILLPGFGHAKTWKINDDHSDLSFTVNYLKVSSVRGRFDKLSGEVKFKGEMPQSVNLEIKTRSINTGNKLRDSHLRRADFLNVKKFPRIKYRSKTISQLNENV